MPQRSDVALVVYSLSRLARSTRDAIEIAERLDRAGADLVSLTERLDTTSAAGKMLFRMLAVLAEIRTMRTAGRSYRAIANELTRRGVPTKKGRGRWSHMAVVGIVKREAQRRCNARLA
ncbi:MAG: recombinase family protein [Planctomycetes bacterium]|nr:recombinase family protein [Planctomycetota bacterium]